MIVPAFIVIMADGSTYPANHLCGVKGGDDGEAPRVTFLSNGHQVTVPAEKVLRVDYHHEGNRCYACGRPYRST